MVGQQYYSIRPGSQRCDGQSDSETKNWGATRCKVRIVKMEKMSDHVDGILEGKVEAGVELSCRDETERLIQIPRFI